MIELVAAISVVAMIASLGRWLHFDHDRSYYPTLLIVIALAYLLMGAIAGHTQVIIAEMAFASIFIGAAILGTLYSYKWVAIFLIVHGIFDLAHPYLIANEVVPDWYALFCCIVDVLLGCWVWYLDDKRTLPTPLKRSSLATSR